MSNTQAERLNILNHQMQIIGGYISKIDLDKLDIETVRDMLSHDFDFLHQEYALLEAENLIGLSTPPQEGDAKAIAEAAWAKCETTLLFFGNRHNDEYIKEKNQYLQSLK